MASWLPLPQNVSQCSATPPAVNAWLIVQALISFVIAVIAVPPCTDGQIHVEPNLSPMSPLEFERHARANALHVIRIMNLLVSHESVYSWFKTRAKVDAPVLT